MGGEGDQPAEDDHHEKEGGDEQGRDETEDEHRVGQEAPNRLERRRLGEELAEELTAKSVPAHRPAHHEVPPAGAPGEGEAVHVGGALELLPLLEQALVAALDQPGLF